MATETETNPKIIKGVRVHLLIGDSYWNVEGDLEFLPSSNNVIIHNLDPEHWEDDEDLNNITTICISKDKITYYGILAEPEDEDSDEEDKPVEENPEKVSLLKKLFGGE